MNAAGLRQRLKPWMMPVGIVLGIFLHDAISVVAWAVPYLIFTMLFITFCRVRPSEIRITPVIWRMLAVQILGSVFVFLLLRPFSALVAQAAFICVLCPTATAAPVVTGMLGGNIARVASYSIICNTAVAVVAPFLFVLFGRDGAGSGFVADFAAIGVHVAPLIVLPLMSAMLLYLFGRPLHTRIAKAQGVSFYLWCVSLIIVVGRAVSFVLSEPSTAVPVMLVMAAVAALVCLAQFYVGRRIGRKSGDPVSTGQGLGQKNTVLAIWMSINFLDPLSSVGPAAYIVWQNSLNSYQLYRKMKADSGAGVINK